MEREQKKQELIDEKERIKKEKEDERLKKKKEQEEKKVRKKDYSMPRNGGLALQSLGLVKGSKGGKVLLRRLLQKFILA